MRSRVTCSIFALICLAACGPGDLGDPSDADPRLDLGAPKDGGVVGDPHNCGELGLDCTGPLGVGECVNDECGAQVGYQCWSPEFAPTCDAYCEAFEHSCVELGCEGATAYGWAGNQWDADNACLSADVHTMIPLTVTCDQPLEGLITTLSCCCDFPAN